MQIPEDQGRGGKQIESFCSAKIFQPAKPPFEHRIHLFEDGIVAWDSLRSRRARMPSSTGISPPMFRWQRVLILSRRSNDARDRRVIIGFDWRFGA